jgi:hypothetical protein
MTPAPVVAGLKTGQTPVSSLTVAFVTTMWWLCWPRVAGLLGCRQPDMLEIDQASERLGAIDEPKAKVIEMCYFGGMDREEVTSSPERPALEEHSGTPKKHLHHDGSPDGE